MTGKAAAAIVAVLLSVLVLCALGGAALLGGGTTACIPSLPSGATALTVRAGGWPTVGAYSPSQVELAATIVSVGAGIGVPVRGWVIAVATAIQESSLSNPTGGDRDSIGLFQQRPSQGWGTPEQLHDPTYASGKFYAKLLSIPNWQQLPLTEAAQAVQVSGSPQAYASRETDATMLVNAIGTGVFWPDASATPVGGFTCGAGQASGSVSLPGTWTLPADTPPAVATAIMWALAQLGTPYSFGGDCTDPHGGQPAHQCDCSSLVQMAYHAANITIPRVTTDQIHAGVAVADIGQIKPGDLVFIPGSDGTPQQPGHVGLFIGDGMIIQAPQRGESVKISLLESWTAQISIIRRIV